MVYTSIPLHIRITKVVVEEIETSENSIVKLELLS